MSINIRAIISYFYRPSVQQPYVLFGTNTRKETMSQVLRGGKPPNSNLKVTTIGEYGANIMVRLETSCNIFFLKYKTRLFLNYIISSKPFHVFLSYQGWIGNRGSSRIFTSGLRFMNTVDSHYFELNGILKISSSHQ